MTPSMTFVPLQSRALLAVSGPDWRSFLQGLLTQDVESLAPGEACFGGLLTPQGRLLHDLFIVGREDGAWLDVEAEHRDVLLQRLTMYRLRAKVELATDDTAIIGIFSAHSNQGQSQDGQRSALESGTISRPSSGRAGEVWVGDPRLPELGWRGYGAAAPANVQVADEATYDTHRLGLGVPGSEDWGSEATYPIEANFDLLGGIDFGKGCYVGQETTSRMKRRGQVKSRMLPIVFEGLPPAPRTEILAGELRAGEVLAGQRGRAMALLRLDRAAGAGLTADGRPVRVERPAWFSAALGVEAA